MTSCNFAGWPHTISIVSIAAMHTPLPTWVNSRLAASQEARLLFLQKLPRRSSLLRTVCIEFPGVGNLLYNIA